MKREARKMYTKGEILVRAIVKQYNEISPDSEYHDAMYYQKNGAYEELAELEEYLDREVEQWAFATATIKKLEDTLKACKLANKIDDMKSKLNFIFG